MAEVSGLDMVREIIGQINNLRRLVTINGKKFKWDGKKYVRAVDGKTFTKKELVSFVKDERFRAPGTDNPRKDPSRPQKQNLGDKLKSKTKSVTSNIKKTTGQTVNEGNKILQNLKLRIGQPNADSTTTRALKINKYLRGLNPTTVAGGLVKGGANFGIGMGADWLANQAVDRTSRAIAGKNKMSLEDYRTARDRGDFKGTLRNKLGINPTYDRPQPTVTRDRRGKVTSTQQPVGRNWIEPPYGDGKQPKISYEPEKVVTPPNQGTDSTKKETVDKNKVKKVKFNANAPDMGYDTKKTKKDKPKNKLKSGFSERQIKSQIRNLKRRNKASNRMKIKRLQALL